MGGSPGVPRKPSRNPESEETRMDDRPDQGVTGAPGVRPSGPAEPGMPVRLGEVAAAAALFVMMAVTVIDVIGRYVFRMPLPASFELTEYLMGLLVFIAAPLAAQRGENIRITLFDRFLPPAVLRAREVAFGVLAAAVILGIAWRVAVLAGQMRGYGDSTQTLRIPLAPLGYFIAASLALTALIFLSRALRSARGAVQAGGGEWA